MKTKTKANTEENSIDTVEENTLSDVSSGYKLYIDDFVEDKVNAALDLFIEGNNSGILNPNDIKWYIVSNYMILQKRKSTKKESRVTYDYKLLYKNFIENKTHGDFYYNYNRGDKNDLISGKEGYAKIEKQIRDCIGSLRNREFEKVNFDERIAKEIVEILRFYFHPVFAVLRKVREQSNRDIEASKKINLNDFENEMKLNKYRSLFCELNIEEYKEILEKVKENKKYEKVNALLKLELDGDTLEKLKKEQEILEKNKKNIYEKFKKKIKRNKALKELCTQKIYINKMIFCIEQEQRKEYGKLHYEYLVKVKGFNIKGENLEKISIIQKREECLEKIKRLSFNRTVKNNTLENYKQTFKKFTLGDFEQLSENLNGTKYEDEIKKINEENYDKLYNEIKRKQYSKYYESLDLKEYKNIFVIIDKLDFFKKDPKDFKNWKLKDYKEYFASLDIESLKEMEELLEDVSYKELFKKLKFEEYEDFIEERYSLSKERHDERCKNGNRESLNENEIKYEIETLYKLEYSKEMAAIRALLDDEIDETMLKIGEGISPIHNKMILNLYKLKLKENLIDARLNICNYINALNRVVKKVEKDILKETNSVGYNININDNSKKMKIELELEEINDYPYAIDTIGEGKNTKGKHDEIQFNYEYAIKDIEGYNKFIDKSRFYSDCKVNEDFNEDIYNYYIKKRGVHYDLIKENRKKILNLNDIDFGFEI